MTRHQFAVLPNEKRADLFRIASREFATHGFAGASLNRIIAAVGMSKSSFYHYFDDKTDLYRQILKQALEPLQKLGAMLDPDKIAAEDFWPALDRISRAMVADLGQSPEMIDVARMFYRSLDSTEERALTKDLMQSFNSFLALLLQRGRALGQVRSDLPESLLLELSMAIGVSIDRWMLAHWEELDQETRLALSGEMLDVFRRILGR